MTAPAPPHVLLLEDAPSLGRLFSNALLEANLEVEWVQDFDDALHAVTARRPDLIVVAFYPVNDTDHKLRKYERYNRLRAIHPLLLDLYRLPRQLYLRQFIKGARRALRVCASS